MMKQLKKIKRKRWEEGLLVTMVGIKHAPSWGYPKLEDKKRHVPSWNNQFTEIYFGENNK